MKIQPYIEKLNTSSEYKEFQKKYKDAFLVAGFFILDFETGKNINQIDYYIPSQKKVAAFTLEDKVMVQILDTLNEKIPEELDINTNVDLDALKGILEDEMKNRNITADIKKIIAVIQNVEGKKTWILNCVLSGMDILRAHIEDSSKTVLKMEKASILDYIRKMPRQEMPQPTEKDIDEQIRQLEKLKGELRKQEKSEGDSEEKHNALIKEKSMSEFNGKSRKKG